jgi:hypothetical protein
MKTAFAALVIILFGATTAAGQSVGQLQTQSQNSYSVGAMESHPGAGTETNNSAGRSQALTLCPALMHAQHVADGTLVKTRSAHPGGVGQWLHLTLMPRDSKPIAKATLTIRGYSPKGRLAQAGSTQNEGFDVVRTMTVPFTSGKDGSGSADFLVPGMTAVGRIDLTSLAYADGSTWSIAADASCRASPDLFMAVTSR